MAALDFADGWGGRSARDRIEAAQTDAAEALQISGDVRDDLADLAADLREAARDLRGEVARTREAAEAARAAAEDAAQAAQAFGARPALRERLVRSWAGVVALLRGLA